MGIKSLPILVLEHTGFHVWGVQMLGNYGQPMAQNIFSLTRVSTT